MIPPDVASSLRLILPDPQTAANAQTQPVTPAQQIADVLSNLVPGQRILAEIQALLPNGNYRAVVAQRDVTLALPFSAKPGDSLELEVTESDGKLALAFVANRTSGSAASTAPQESVPTTLSSAGKLIGNLMNGLEGEGKRPLPATLNGNQALVETMPKNAAELAPVLKQALTQSGMFYEAHQARWVAGQLPTETLRQEPQAKYSPAPIPVTDQRPPEAKFAEGIEPDTGIKTTSIAPRSEQATPTTQTTQGTQPTPATQTTQATQPTQTTQNSPAGNPIPRELTPLVQQQLDGLATQNFAWQGQVWPGQQMQWEIGNNPNNARSQDGAALAQWQTRLKLSLPTLGGIDAVLHLRVGGEVGITVTTDSETSETSLRESTEQLRSQFESAGLKLTQLLVRHATLSE